MRKGQIIGQIFIFVLAALIFVLILLYGYRAISGFLKTKEQVEVTEFKTELESKVKAIRISYGSVRRAEFVLPATYLEFCAVDPNMSPNHANMFSESHPLMYNAWFGDPSNTIFLRPLLETSIQLEDVAVKGPQNPDEPGYLCLPITSGKLVIGMRGLGDRAEIIPWADQ